MAQRHDRAEALHKALYLFWEKGFNGTSIKDLEHHLGMHPGSIYAAFGSKAGLFARALQLYADQMMSGHYADCVGETKLHALAEAVRQSHPIAQHDGPKAACFICKSLMETGIDAPEVHAALNRLADAFEDQFTEMFEQARSAGELAPDADCRALAQSVQTALAGISTLVLRPNRQEQARQMLEQLALDIVALGQGSPSAGGFASCLSGQSRA